MSAGHHIEGQNKKVALLIAVLAACLALSETLGKSAQTDALSDNIEASNLWAFFQAKTIRVAVLRASTERLEFDKADETPREDRTKIQLERWASTLARLDSEPETQEGRKQLSARAKAAEGRRDLSLARYHHYEVASAAIQIAIVLASATVITSVWLLAWLAAGLGIAGVLLTAVGFWAPHSLHLF